MAQASDVAPAPLEAPAQPTRLPVQQPEDSHPNILMKYLFLDTGSEFQPEIEVCMAQLCNSLAEMDRVKRAAEDAAEEGNHELATEMHWKRIQERGSSKMLKRIQPHCEPKVDPTIQGNVYGKKVDDLVETMTRLGQEQQGEVQRLKTLADVASIQERRLQLQEMLKPYKEDLASSSQDAAKVLNPEEAPDLDELEEFGGQFPVMLTGEIFLQLREKLERDEDGDMRLTERIPGLNVPPGAWLTETKLVMFDQNDSVTDFDIMGDKPFPTGCTGIAYFETEASESKDDETLFHAVRSKPRTDILRHAHCVTSLAAEQLAELDDNVSDSKPTPPKMKQTAAEIDEKREAFSRIAKDHLKQAEGQQRSAIKHVEESCAILQALKASQEEIEGLRGECMDLVVDKKTKVQKLLLHAVKELLEAEGLEECYHALCSAHELHPMKVQVEENNVQKLGERLKQSTDAIANVRTAHEAVIQESKAASAGLCEECKSQASLVQQLKEDTKCLVQLAVTDAENELTELEAKARKQQAISAQTDRADRRERSQQASLQKQLEKFQTHTRHQKAALQSLDKKLPAASVTPEVEARVRRELYDPIPSAPSAPESFASMPQAAPAGGGSAIELLEKSRLIEERLEKRFKDQMAAAVKMVTTQMMEKVAQVKEDAKKETEKKIAEVREGQQKEIADLRKALSSTQQELMALKSAETDSLASWQEAEVPAAPAGELPADS